MTKREYDALERLVRAAENLDTAWNDYIEDDLTDDFVIECIAELRAALPAARNYLDQNAT